MILKTTRCNKCRMILRKGCVLGGFELVDVMSSGSQDLFKLKILKVQSLQYNSVCAGFFIIVCLCSDLISSVFPALSCCLLHLWSHPEGRCRTESVPLHVGDTQYVLYSVYSVLYIILYSIHYVIQYSNLLLRLCVCLQTTVHGLKLQKGRTWML